MSPGMATGRMHVLGGRQGGAVVVLRYVALLVGVVNKGEAHGVPAVGVVVVIGKLHVGLDGHLVALLLGCGRYAGVGGVEHGALKEAVGVVYIVVLVVVAIVPVVGEHGQGALEDEAYATLAGVVVAGKGSGLWCDDITITSLPMRSFCLGNVGHHAGASGAPVARASVEHKRAGVVRAYHAVGEHGALGAVSEVELDGIAVNAVVLDGHAEIVVERLARGQRNGLRLREHARGRLAVYLGNLCRAPRVAKRCR